MILKIIVIFLILWTFPDTKANESCKTADIGLIIDSSGSIVGDYLNNPVHWSQIKSFIKKLMRSFNIGEGNFKFAANQFGTRVRNLITFKDTPTLANYEDILKYRLKWPTGTTNMLDAIRSMKKLFEGQGTRTKAPDIYILITDGKPYPTNQNPIILNIVKDLKSKGASFITIGVTKNIDRSLLTNIASNKDLFINISKFSELQRISKSMLGLVCKTVKRVSCESGDRGDIGLMLDSSGSIVQDYFNVSKHWFEVQTFVRQLLGSFKIGQKHFKFAINQFNDNAKNLITLKDQPSYANYDRILKSRLEWPNGMTNMLDAVVKLKEVFSDSSNRPNAPDVFVLITDGKPYPKWQNAKIMKIVKELKEKGVTFITVGVTKNINETLLRKIASRDDLYVKINQFSDFKRISGGLFGSICNSVKKFRTAAPVCHKMADIGLMIDSSGSIKEDTKQNLNNWNSIKDFVKKLISNFKISNYDFKFAAEKFGNEIKTIFSLNDTPNVNNYIHKINTRIGQPNGKTNLLGAIKTMEEMFENNKGNRKNALDIFILITDGYPNPAWQAKYVLDAVNNLKNRKNVTLISIGMTKRINETFMRQISGDNFIHIPKFSQLVPNLNKVYRKICDARPLAAVQLEQNIKACSKGNKLDVGIMMDTSASLIGDTYMSNWYKIQQFTKEVLVTLSLRSSETKFAINRFSTVVERLIGLEDNGNFASYLKILNRRTKLGRRGTNLLAAIEDMENTFKGRGNRRNAPDVFLLITDGCFNSESEMYKVKKKISKLISSGIQFYVIGISNEPYEGFLKSSVGSENFIHVWSLSKLDQKIEMVVNKVCQHYRRPIIRQIMY
ncbi:DgyrCDS10189 [Dimorphilus gyrociliatus]|uniref:DgyrCDS10189 n=1 Tax=Dimorphilus gyrociliatus TaxID=2664684 RepID=A0A7I8W1G9_9ANNE|nr:DgyrCDS10189 [Dimorphilus gyrociliatus]